MNKTLYGIAAALLMAVPAVTSAATDIAMHRDPGCGCCEKWAAQVRQQFGRNVRIIDDANRAAFQRQVGVPVKLASCHTAMIDGIAFRGHVPIADMKRVLAQHPKGISGLAVAGMPLGSPGWRAQGPRHSRSTWWRSVRPGSISTPITGSRPPVLKVEHRES